MGIPRDVIELAVDHGGFLTREQLRACGLSGSVIDRLIRRREIRPTVAGVFQIIPPRTHFDLLRGALLALPEAVASHQSAAHLLRFPELPRAIPTVTVAQRTTHRFPGVTVRRADDLHTHHLTSVSGIRCTIPARTVFDLAGIMSYRRFVTIAEASIATGMVSVDDLEAVLGELRRRGKPGCKAVDDLLAGSQGASGSALERRGRSLLESSSLAPPTAEFPIPWEPRRRFDDAYPAHRVAIEWDSRRWHERRAAMQVDRERDREAVMHGWVVIRFTWRDVVETPTHVIASISQILADRPALRP